MRYSAFISYSHCDAACADRLHRSIESYRLPKSARERAVATRKGGDRLLPVFRDREELSSAANLGEAIREALTESSALIVICSPAAARSR